VSRRDRIAQMGRDEHEFRESLRKRKGKLRGFAKKNTTPQLAKSNRTAGRHDSTPADLAARVDFMQRTSNPEREP
jgi:hypothetical protein